MSRNLAKVISINTVTTDKSGNLQIIESIDDLGFEIKRIYYTTEAIAGTHRGGHAHKKLKQLIFCPYGSIQLRLTDGKNNQEIMLDNPRIGVIITKPLWREILWIQDNSVLCCAASETYSESDYIRSYDDYITFLKEGNL